MLHIVIIHQQEHSLLPGFLLVPSRKAMQVAVEFVGPQQPNGEMAQWGNMA